MKGFPPDSVLKPCRHCGREVKIQEVTHYSEVYFMCRVCEPRYVIRCKCGIQTKEYKTKSGVIKCWNREVT